MRLGSALPFAPCKGVEQVADRVQLGRNGDDLAVKQIFRASSLFLQKLLIGLQARGSTTVGGKRDFLNSFGGVTCPGSCKR